MAVFALSQIGWSVDNLAPKCKRQASKRESANQWETPLWLSLSRAVYDYEDKPTLYTCDTAPNSMESVEVTSDGKRLYPKALCSFA